MAPRCSSSVAAGMAGGLGGLGGGTWTPQRAGEPRGSGGGQRRWHGGSGCGPAWSGAPWRGGERGAVHRPRGGDRTPGCSTPLGPQASLLGRRSLALGPRGPCRDLARVGSSAGGGAAAPPPAPRSPRRRDRPRVGASRPIAASSDLAGARPPRVRCRRGDLAVLDLARRQAGGSQTDATRRVDGAGAVGRDGHDDRPTGSRRRQSGVGRGFSGIAGVRRADGARRCGGVGRPVGQSARGPRSDLPGLDAVGSRGLARHETGVGGDPGRGRGSVRHRSVSRPRPFGGGRRRCGAASESGPTPLDDQGRRRRCCSSGGGGCPGRRASRTRPRAAARVGELEDDDRARPGPLEDLDVGAVDDEPSVERVHRRLDALDVSPGPRR